MTFHTRAYTVSGLQDNGQLSRKEKSVIVDNYRYRSKEEKATRVKRVSRHVRSFPFNQRETYTVTIGNKIFHSYQ